MGAATESTEEISTMVYGTCLVPPMYVPSSMQVPAPVPKAPPMKINVQLGDSAASIANTKPPVVPAPPVKV